VFPLKFSLDDDDVFKDKTAKTATNRNNKIIIFREFIFILYNINIKKYNCGRMRPDGHFGERSEPATDFYYFAHVSYSYMKKIDFDNKFQVLTNAADGNCLFLAISQLDERFDHLVLRKKLCTFYKKLVIKANVSDDSLLGKLRIQMIMDNIEYDENSTHDKRVCENYAYGGVMDVIVLAYILQRPIHLYQKLVFKSKEPTDLKFDIFDDETIRTKPPIHLLYSGNNHFEALKLQSPIYISSTSTSPIYISSTSPIPSPTTSPRVLTHYKVLVVCQRKEGSCYPSQQLLVQKTVIPMITQFLSSYLKTTNYTTEYGSISDLLSDSGVLILSKVDCEDYNNPRPNLFKISPDLLIKGNISTFFDFKDGVFTKKKSATDGNKKKRKRPLPSKRLKKKGGNKKTLHRRFSL
jgi:hypothetical protein